MGGLRSSHLVALVLLSVASAGAAALGQAADNGAPIEAVRELHEAVPVPSSASDLLAGAAPGERKRVRGTPPCIRSIQGVGRDRADLFDYLTEEIDGEHAVRARLAYFPREGEERALGHEPVRTHGKRWLAGGHAAGAAGASRGIHRFPRLLNGRIVHLTARRCARSVAFATAT